MPPGLECYGTVKPSAAECLRPCKGVYAEVEREGGGEEVERMDNFKPVLDRYKEYKSGFRNDTKGNSLIFFLQIFTAMFY